MGSLGTPIRLPSHSDVAVVLGGSHAAAISTGVAKDVTLRAADAARRGGARRAVRGGAGLVGHLLQEGARLGLELLIRLQRLQVQSFRSLERISFWPEVREERLQVPCMEYLVWSTLYGVPC